jgi:hypothetical protein
MRTISTYEMLKEMQRAPAGTQCRMDASVSVYYGSKEQKQYLITVGKTPIRLSKIGGRDYHLDIGSSQLSFTTQRAPNDFNAGSENITIRASFPKSTTIILREISDLVF